MEVTEFCIPCIFIHTLLLLVCLWQIAWPTDSDVECHMAEGSPSTCHIVSQGLCTDQHWRNNSPCQPQHTADRRCVLRGR